MGVARVESGQPTGRRLALLICNGDFPHLQTNALAGPKKDAKLLEEVLSDPDTCAFEVRVLVDGGLLEARREVARICADAGRDDTILIYYSGNGLSTRGGSRWGDLYLLVNDSEQPYLTATALDAEFILSQLRGSKCRRIVLLLDACYSGAFFANNRGIPDGLYAITSCAGDEKAHETAEGGLFTRAVCEGLRDGAADVDGDGRVSIDELQEFVKARLTSQTPQKWVWNVPDPIFLATVPKHYFLSYAREDMDAADRLVRGLEAEGLKIWIDRVGIQAGSWKERVTEGLNRSRAVLMLLTKDSLASEAVRKELGFAAMKGVPIVPVQLGEFAEVLPDWFALDYRELHRHVLDLRAYEEGVGSLARALRTTKRVPPSG